MARQVLPIVGAIVGSFFGAPQLGFFIGSIVGNAVDPEVVKGPRIGEASLQTSAEGVFRPIVFGTAAVKGNVIDRGNRQVKTQREGGKGGPVVETQRVYWTFAIRICEGPIDAVLRIWQDEKLVYDIRPGSTIVEESAEFAEGFRLYLGGEDQLPDPDLEVFRGEGNTPAYRGSAYIVFPNFDLTDRRESIPDFRFEVASRADTSSTETAWEYVGDLGPRMRDVDGNASGFFAVGVGSGLEAGQIWASQPDGTGWVNLTLPVTGWSFTSVGVGGGMVVASRDFNNVLWNTIPLGTWHQVTTASTDAYSFTMFVGSHWLRVGRNGSSEWSDHPEGPWTYVNRGTSASAERAVQLGSLVIVFDSTGGIQRSGDGGKTWTAAAIIADPHPGAQWTGAAARTGAIHGYKKVDASTLAIYHSIDGNVFSVTLETIVDYDGGNIGVVNGVWSGGREDEIPLPDYPLVYQSPNGFLPFSPGDVAGGIGAGSSFSKVIRVVDGGEGAAVILGYKDGDDGSFVYRTEYAGGSEAVAEPIPLSDIVEAVHRRVGHTLSQYDVSELTDLVEGVVFAGDYTGASAIRALMPVYFFDASEHDSGTGYRIHYRKRGKPVVLTLTEDDLLERPDVTVREDSLERPRILHLHYENPTVGYVPAKATARRDSPDVLVVGEVSEQVPVAFSDVNQPAKIANQHLKIAWVEVAGEEQFSAHDGFLELVPGDCIGVTIRGQTRRLRITQEQLLPGEMRWKLIADRQSAYTSAVTGVPVPVPTPPLPSIVGATVHELLDIPALNDNNDRLVWYEAATGQTEAWFGAQTQRKIAPATEFTNSARFTSGTVMGVLLDPITAASPHYSDRTNVVRVDLYRPGDEIDALTEAQFLSEGGAFALENDDGTWEVLQYRDADEEGAGVFALSHLARGRLNTGGHAHGIGTRFVLLDGAQAVDAQSGWIGADVTMRAVSFNTSPDAATQTTYRYTGQSQREFPVAHLFLSRAGDTLTARAVPRHRFGTEDNPVRSANWTGYRWTATDGANSVTFDTVTETVTFDVAGWASPVTVTAAQLNRITGPGPTVSEHIA